MPSRSALRLGTGLVAAALTVAGCTGDRHADRPAPTRTTPVATAAPISPATATETAAATLRATLTQLLREHVDLTGFLVQTATGTGLTSPQTSAATAVLDENTRALGKAIGAAYGSAAQQSFLSMWRAHIGYFVTYTKGVATNDPAMRARAQAQLSGYAADFAAFVSARTSLPAPTVTADLTGHVTSLESAIDSIVAKKPDAASRLQAAATHMDGTAAALAQGIAVAKKVTGTTDSPAATLRASLTGLLVQHAAQTGVLVQTAVQNGLTAAPTAAAATALDENTRNLGAIVGSVYGAGVAASFVRMWRAQVGGLTAYLRAVAGNDAATTAAARARLAGTVSGMATFVSATTKLPAAVVAADLTAQVQTAEAAIDSIVAKRPDAASRLSMAEDHMAGTAGALARGIVASAPDRFGG